MDLKEKLARQQEIDALKKEIAHYTDAVKSSPKFAFFYNDKIRWLECKLTSIQPYKKIALLTNKLEKLA